MKKIVIALGVIIVILLGVLLFYNPAKAPPVSPNNNTTSTAPVAPAAIVSADGHLAVTSLHANDLVASPLTVSGTVTGGGWFFEASFPVKVLDGNGTTIGKGTAQAQADWTSTSSVPFTAIVSFTAPLSATGTVVLSKDNPSGLPQNDASLSIPVRFK
jgi:heme/copper-type cytochrome/quinol oxidase subunit 2